MPAPRKLIALDPDDLAVISAHVQDARVRAGDIIWRQSEKRLVIGLNRLDWNEVLLGNQQRALPAPRRMVSALRFERVLSCKSRNIDLDAPDTALELLGIEFHPGEPPGGATMLMFADGGALRLDVECLECELADLGEDDLGAADVVVEPPVGV
jgi:hypothetical protein